MMCLLPIGPTDLTDITELTHTAPEFIQGQKQLLEAFANSNSALYDNKRSPHDKFAEPMVFN